MPNDHNAAPNRRPHYHRGRRGGDRRGQDRRSTPNLQESSNRDHVDVEQIMRDIRSRISKRHGIDLSAQQIQELAARRLDAILEPRHTSPALMEQMRRAAGEAIQVPEPVTGDANADFDEASLYTSHRSLLQTLRRWLNPILKLFINPTPLAAAVREQAQRSNAAAAREREFYARQAEWNALHFEILQRLVTETSRASIELQSLTLRVESLASRVDFNERRVRSVETPSTHQPRPPVPRPMEPVSSVQELPRPTVVPGAAPSAEATAAAASPSASASAAESTGDAPRKRRRRRRGRRSGAAAGPGGLGQPCTSPAPFGQEQGSDLEGDADDDNDSEGEEIPPAAGDGTRAASEPAGPAVTDVPPPPPVIASPSPAPIDAQPEPAADPPPDTVGHSSPPRDEALPTPPPDHADQGPPER